MKFITDFVSFVLSIALICGVFFYVEPIVNETEKQTQTIYPDKVRQILYIDRTFTKNERESIVAAAEEWEKSTKGIVTYEIVQLPDYDPLNFDNSLFIIKISPDDPEVLLMNNEDNILGYYTSRRGLPTIAIVEGRIENKNFKSIIMHEIGHALGLKHQSEDKDIGTLMYPYVKINIAGITLDISSDKITKTDLTQFCSLYHCDVDELLK